MSLPSVPPAIPASLSACTLISGRMFIQKVYRSVFSGMTHYLLRLRGVASVAPSVPGLNDRSHFRPFLRSVCKLKFWNGLNAQADKTVVTCKL